MCYSICISNPRNGGSCYLWMRISDSASRFLLRYSVQLGDFARRSSLATTTPSDGSIYTTFRTSWPRAGWPLTNVVHAVAAAYRRELAARALRLEV
jgi:hypothetical protein